MAQIRKRGTSYQFIVADGEDANGKRIERTMTYHPDMNLTPKQREKAMKKALMEFEEKVKRGIAIDGERITFEEFYQKWYNDYAVVELEQTTLYGYDHNIRTLVIPKIGRMKLSSIKPIHLTSLYNSLREDGVRQDGKEGGYSATTINMVHMTISAILKKAVEWDVIMFNPCDRVATPKRSKDSDAVEFFTVEQAQTFLRALDMVFDQPVKARKRIDSNGNEYTVTPYTYKVKIPLMFKVLFNIAIYGGLRRGELVSLTWDDVDFKNQTIRISKSTAYVNRQTYIKSPKTKSSNREISLPSSVMGLLAKYQEEYTENRERLGTAWATDDSGKPLNYLFIQRSGKQMALATPRKRFLSIIKQYNETVDSEEDKLPLIHFHGLRHTSATLLIAQGIDIATVAGRLGHSQTSTTLDIYTHQLRKLDKVASEKLEDLLADGND